MRALICSVFWLLSPARVIGDLQLLLAKMRCFMAIALRGLVLISRISHAKGTYGGSRVSGSRAKGFRVVGFWG